MESHKQENKQLRTRKEIKARMKIGIQNPSALNLFIEFEKLEDLMRQLATKHEKFSCDSARYNDVANAFNLAQDKVFENFVKGERRKHG